MTSHATAPYLTAAAAMRERITAGAWPPGTRLPARATLALELLGRPGGENIIRRAQELLTEEGLLEARTGSGTYVREPDTRTLICSPVTGVMPQGLRGTWTADPGSVAGVAAPHDVAVRLQIAVGAPCVRTDYTVHGTSGSAVMAVTSWEPVAVTAGTPVMLPTQGPLAGHSVSDRMRHIGLVVDRVTETLHPAQLTPDQAKRVTARVGAPALLITRVHHASDRPVETADMIVPGAHCTLAYEHRL
ncbi:GntR family transcriptional regulator [Streptomyces murinus]|uniref:GntR family transcriptional regulator n=1 Tax=Streptomyces murinus TaxID=33900 RepID=UPI0038006286